MTFEELQQANSLIKTVAIKGKNYAQVPERIKAFRSLFPTGTIETELLSNANGVCVFKATVRIGETILGVGHAYEKEDSSFINQTSFIENCETSAVGRALGMAGFGIDVSIASAEELATALMNQGTKVCKDCGKEIKSVMKRDGELWDAGAMASYSTRKYGRALCAECMKKEDKK